MSAKSITIDSAVAESLRHGAQCIDELVDKGEPMGERNTYRRGFNAADEYLVEQTPLKGSAFEKAADKMGDVAIMAHKHGINGKDAAEFYRNKADAIIECNE